MEIHTKREGERERDRPKLGTNQREGGEMEIHTKRVREREREREMLM